MEHIHASVCCAYTQHIDVMAQYGCVTKCDQVSGLICRLCKTWDQAMNSLYHYPYQFFIARPYILLQTIVSTVCIMYFLRLHVLPFVSSASRSIFPAGHVASLVWTFVCLVANLPNAPSAYVGYARPRCRPVDPPATGELREGRGWDGDNFRISLLCNKDSNR